MTPLARDRGDGVTVFDLQLRPLHSYLTLRWEASGAGIYGLGFTRRGAIREWKRNYRQRESVPETIKVRV